MTHLATVSESKHSKILTSMSTILLSIALLAASGQIFIPWQPVPVTLQSAVVIFLGMAYGPKVSFISVSSYLLLGLIGAPIFVGFTAGPAVLLGPTAGYLVSFPFAAALSGCVAQKFGKSLYSYLLAGSMGIGLMLLLGGGYLSSFTGWSFAWKAGIAAFLPIAALKLLTVATSMRWAQS